MRVWASDIDSAQLAEQAALRGLKHPAIGDAVHAAQVAAVHRQIAN